ncbi:hypothetical protein AC1031_006172 [Aphanomyces cochlioides]|nr:hypothetical protein AC1031_006172 [Aphanomyces cochlioides]
MASMSTLSTRKKTPQTISPQMQRWILQVAQCVHEQQGRPAATILTPVWFKVPNKEPFAPHLHGISFSVSSFRREKREGRLDPRIVAALDEIGFVWDLKQHQWDLRLRALATYNRVFGHLCVPKMFVVPANDAEWEKDLWNFRLGSAVDHIRSGLTTVSDEHREALDAMGFVWDAHEYQWGRYILALETYKAIYGDVLVHCKFVVPENNAEWPETTWNLNLGAFVHDLRTELTSRSLKDERRAELDALGFVWAALDYQLHRNIRALERYKQLHGNLLVPLRFVVPSNDPDWPEDFADIHLGHFVGNIRSGVKNLTPSERETLDAMGFVWNADDYEWNRNLMALEVYKRIYGDLLVRYKFIVPDQDPAWPPQTWNLKLGYMVNNLRRRPISNAKKAQLDALGFIWRVRDSQANSVK